MSKIKPDEVETDALAYGGLLSLTEDDLKKALAVIDAINAGTIPIDVTNIAGNFSGFTQVQQVVDMLDDVSFGEVSSKGVDVTDDNDGGSVTYVTVGDGLAQPATLDLTTQQNKALISFKAHVNRSATPPTSASSSLQLVVTGATSFTKELPMANAPQYENLDIVILTPPLNAGVNTFTIQSKSADSNVSTFTGIRLDVLELSTLEVERTITGNVVDPGATPLVGVAVSAPAYGINTVTDGSGDYTLANVPGSTNVQVLAAFAGYNSVIEVTDISGSNQIVDFTLAQRTVSGVVLSSEGGPVAGASVFITALGKSTTTDAGGNYSLIDVEDGSHTLEITQGQHVDFSVGIVVAADLVQNATLTANVVSGTITSDTTSQVIASASVAILTESDVSDAGGAYQLNKVAEGAQTLVASKLNFSAYSNGIVVTQGVNATSFQMAAVEFEAGVISPNGTSFTWRNSSPDSYSGDTFGNTITISGTVQLTGFQYMVGSGGSSYPITFKVYNSAGTVIATVNHTHVSAEAYTVVNLGAPILLTTGVYKVTAYTASATPGGFVQTIGAGDGLVNGVLASGSVGNYAGNDAKVSIGNGYYDTGDVEPNTLKVGKLYGISMRLKV